MSCRSLDSLAPFVLGAVLVAAGSAAPAAAAGKQPERITQGSGPATLTAAERAKAEQAGIRMSDAVSPSTGPAARPALRVEHHPLVSKPIDVGTRLPSIGPRDRAKPAHLAPIDRAKTGARP